MRKQKKSPPPQALLFEVPEGWTWELYFPGPINGTLRPNRTYPTHAGASRSLTIAMMATIGLRIKGGISRELKKVRLVK